MYNNLIASSVCNLKFKLLVLSLQEKINYDIFVMDSDKWKLLHL